MKRSFLRTAMLFPLSLLCLALVAGCLGRTKPPYIVDQYTLDYAAPAPLPTQPLDELVRVERFGIAMEFNSTAMVMRKGQYRLDTYNYSRWRVNPSDIVTGFVLRDITRAGIFKGTYSYYDSDLCRYIIEGYVDEFCESAGKGLVSIRVTLLDTRATNPVEQVVFQKEYKASAPLNDNSPDGLAAALSEAMKGISGRLLADIDLAVRQKVAK